MVSWVGLQSVLVASPGHISFMFFFLNFFFQKDISINLPALNFLPMIIWIVLLILLSIFMQIV